MLIEQAQLTEPREMRLQIHSLFVKHAEVSKVLIFTYYKPFVETIRRPKLSTFYFAKALRYNYSLTSLSPEK